MLHRKFFVVGGAGTSDTSKLNAFDSALVDARIDQCNLVPVSSILPADATPVEFVCIPPGAITFCVLARKDGTEGERISAGICWAACECKETKQRFGLVAEDPASKTAEEAEKELQNKIKEMADARNMKILEHKTKIVTISISEFELYVVFYGYMVIKTGN